MWFKSTRNIPKNKETSRKVIHTLGSETQYIIPIIAPMLPLLSTPSFSDAEILEDVAEDFVGGDFTEDGAEVVEGFAEVLGDEVCRQ